MKLRYLRNVVTLELNVEKCIGCGMCVAVCPHRVFQLTNKKAVITDKNACMECGACGRNCPANAIKVESGVGCATAVINSFLGKTGSECCCCSDNKSNCC